MKISHKDLVALITKEVSGLHEGVLDQLRGRLGDIGSKSGNNKQAGDTASLDGDFERASSKIALQIQQSLKVFKDLLTRAQSMNLQQQEVEIKKEIQALGDYQRTATPPDVKMSLVKPSPAPVDLPPMSAKTTPAPVDLPPMAAKTPAKLYSNSSERRVKSKLDKENIIKVVNKYGGPDNAAAIEIASKKLGISGNAIIQAIKR